MHPRTGGAAIILPVIPGDVVTLLFSDRALNRWKLGLGKVPQEPDNTRMHDLTDCWAFLGGYPVGAPFVGPMLTGTLSIFLAEGMKLHLGSNTVEVVTQMDALLLQLSNLCTALTLLTVICAAPTNPSSVPVNVASFVTIKLQIDAIKVLIDLIKPSA
jgi:hypothetical protein